MLSTIIAAMLKAGCSPEQISAVALTYESESESELERIKQQNRERQARFRERKSNATSRDITLNNVTNVTSRYISSPSSPSPDGFPPALYKNNTTPLPITPTLTPSPRANRGHRLPDDWFPSMEDHSFADRLGVVGEVDKFRDHWHSQPGQKGTKVDWSATWRNWCRRAAERKPKQQSRETPMQTGMRILEEFENAKHERSNSSGNPALVGIQRQPSGSGDIHSPGSNQPRGLLAIIPESTVSPQDWFNLDE